MLPCLAHPTAFQSSITTKRTIVRVPKVPYHKKKPNMFEIDQIPDPRDNFDFLQQSEVGKVIQKTIKSALTDADIDPIFASRTFSPAKHQAQLDKHLKIGGHISSAVKQQIADLVKKYWCCFDDENVKIPIKGYQCVIDTGDAIRYMKPQSCSEQSTPC